MPNNQFTLTGPPTAQTFTEGWGVFVDPIFANEEYYSEGTIEDIEVSVVEINEATSSDFIGGVFCVSVDGMYVPIENFAKAEHLANDDHHDLRTRWFATEEEAREHANWVEQRWLNPEPWTSFVQL